MLSCSRNKQPLKQEEETEETEETGGWWEIGPGSLTFRNLGERLVRKWFSGAEES